MRKIPKDGYKTLRQLILDKLFLEFVSLCVITLALNIYSNHTLKILSHYKDLKCLVIFWKKNPYYPIPFYYNPFFKSIIHIFLQILFNLKIFIECNKTDGKFCDIFFMYNET